jgi:7,8-dihydropterin-6-yl-methyl-4-(beta-D-ribofuranosyl)aminobenzene 5'-phosphate synthase
MTEKMGIRIVAENTAAQPGLLAEHGLAWWIEGKAGRVLFDTGQGKVLTANAFKLDIPLHQADAVVLSHGHYDHTGGLGDVLRVNRPTVFVHPLARLPKYARNRDGTSREIGIPWTCERALNERSRVLVETVVPTAVLDGMMVTGPVPRRTDFEDTGGPFFSDAECTRPDPLLDDQALFFESREGVVVLLGCAHSGVVNTLQYIDELTGGKPIHAVLGGMHLVQASPQRLTRTLQALRAWDIRMLGPAHCTGTAATAAMWHAFPDRCVSCHVGDRFEFELP